ncbi:MAG TPA: GEVED domain-containing protein [Flavipsychrobacter sp.]
MLRNIMLIKSLFMKKSTLIVLLFLLLGVYHRASAQCSTSSTPSHTCSFGDQITSFTLNSIATTGNSGCSSGGYGYFSTSRSLNIGSTYSFSATYGTSSYFQHFAIWIDLNNNGIYENSEQLYTTSSSGTSTSGNITIPSTATSGSVAMRTACRYSSSLGAGDACASYTYGEVEDYTVTLVGSPCSGTPSPGNTLASANPVCAGSSFTLSLQTATSGSGVTYQWQSSSNGTTWSNIGGATSSTLVTSQASPTYYRCNVTCSGNTGTSSSLLVNNSFLACYCTAANTSGCSFGDNISNVTFGTLNNSSGCVGSAPSYINYSGSVSAPNINIGSTNSISVSVGSGGTEHVAVWIDYNHSGTFDASEFTYIGTRGSSGAITNNITVPGTALTGITRMRVRVRWSTTITSGQACTSFSYGETEDYDVNLVCPAITVSTQPANTTICPGGNGSFAVATSTGSGLTTSYQWQQSTNSGSTWSNITNGGVFSGATTATLNLTAAPNTMAGYQYRCVATNQCGNNVNSNAATLSFYTTPVVTSHPTDKTICVNNGTTFSAAVTGTGLSYQWQVSTNGGSTWSNVSNGSTYSNATTAILTVSSATIGMNGYQYRCVTNPCSVITNPALLTVNSLPTVTSNPVDVTICPNSNTSFSCSGTGTGISYQWQVSTNSGVSFSNITNSGVYSGATTATLNITGAPASMDNYRYRCVISGACSPFVITTAAKLTMGANPAVTTQPSSTIVCTGTTGSTSLAATGYNVTYQWQVSTNGGSTWGNIANGGFYAGTTTNTLQFISPVLSMNGYMYRAVVTNACAVATTSNAMTLTVANAPVVNSQPTDKTVCLNSNTSYSVSATSSAPIAYQWQGSVDGVSWTNIANGGIFSGATTSTLSLTGVYLGTFTKYRCELNTGCIPAATTNIATLTIEEQPLISINPSSQVKCVGQNASFAISATGSNLTYQWQVSTNGGVSWGNVTNGGVYAGATTNNLLLTAVPASMNAYRYRCVVTGSCPTVKTSGSATLTVNTPVAVNTNTPTALTFCSGSNTSLFVGATGTGMSYRWYININGVWTALNNTGIYSGVTTSTLNITGISAAVNTQHYLYRCVITGACNTVSSNTTDITVHARPAITSNPSSVTRCDSTGPLSFNVTATGSQLVYQWQLNTGSGWNNLVNNSTYSGVSTPSLGLANIYYSMNGYQYRCVITGICTPTVTTSVATLTVNPLLLPSVVVNVTNDDICAGTSVTFTPSPTNGGTNPTYVWKRNGTAVGTGSSYTTSALANGDLVWCDMTSNAVCPLPKTVKSDNAITMKVTQYSTPTITITSDVGTEWCSGKPAVFRANITNGGPTPTYEWQVNGLVVGANVDTYLTSQLIDGDQVRCRLTSSLKCFTPAIVTSNTIKMTIRQTTQSSIVIAPNPDSVICDKTNVTMYTFFTNGGATPSFQWMLNGADMPGETAGTLKTTGLSNGDFIQCRFISSATCVFPEVSLPVTFSVNPLLDPSVSIVIYYIGNDTYRFTAIPQNGGLNPSYQWYKNNVPISGATSETFDAVGLIKTDKIHVKMASSEECVNPQLLQVSSRNLTTGVGEVAAGFADLGLFPNPNKGQFSIKGTLDKPANNKEIMVKITNSIGQTVHTQAYPAGGTNIDIPVQLQHDLPNGMYQVNVALDGEVTNLRFVLNR